MRESAAEQIYGRLPQRWRYATVSELVNNAAAEIQTGPFGTMLHASAYCNDGTPVIAVQHIGNNRIRHRELPRVGDDDAERLDRYALREGDIVFGRKGAVERRAIITADEAGWLQGSDCIRVRFDHRAVDPNYVAHVLGTRTYQSWITRNAQGATMPSLNQEIIGRIPLPLAPLDQQRAIAHVLGTLDDKIELNRRMNHTLESMARALFKSWFVDFDPVRASAKLKLVHSAVGQIPTTWRVGRLQEIADVLMGASPDGTTYNDAGVGIPLVNGPVEFGDYFPKKSKWTTAPTRLSESGDLILCVRGSTTGRRVLSDGTYCLGRGVCAIRAKQGFQPYVNQTIDSEMERLLSRITGSVFPNLSGLDIKDFQVLIPPADLVAHYSDAVTPLYRLVGVHVRENATLTDVRDALLSKLLSGELRIRDAEKLVKAHV